MDVPLPAAGWTDGSWMIDGQMDGRVSYGCVLVWDGWLDHVRCRADAPSLATGWAGASWMIV